MSKQLHSLCIQFCLLIICFSIISQARAQCDPPDQLPTVQCSNAPVICMQDACFETSTQQDVGWNGFCGSNTAVHNPQYFEIIPTEECIEILIHVDGCFSGAQLQAALVTSCEWQPCPGNSVPCNDILDCDPGTPAGGTMIMTACDLVPGVSLWLLIDGSSGALCRYTITYAEGIYEPQIEEEITSGEAMPNSVCAGYDDLYLSVEPFITNAHGYSWHLGWNDLTVTSTLPFMYLDVPVNAPVGTWDVCVVGFSGCDTTDTPFCFPIEIVDAPNAIKETTHCPEEFPFEWFDITISSPGTYTQSFTAIGCAVDTTWTVNAFPYVPVGILNIHHCILGVYEHFQYEGEVYENPGVYDIRYPGQGTNGCDSLLELNLTISGAEYFIENDCIEGQSVLVPHTTTSINIDTITYEWYDCTLTNLLSTNHTLEIDSAGCYCVIINSGDCTDTVCTNYIGNPCLSECDIVEEQICAGDSILLTTDIPDSLDATVYWTIDPPGNNSVLYTEGKSLWLSYDSIGCYRVTQTIVDATSSVTCIDTFCIIAPSSHASICCSGIACGDCANLEISLTGTPPWDVVISDGSILDTITNITSSSFVYEVCNQFPTIVQYSIVEVINEAATCPTVITGSAAEVLFYDPQFPSEWTFLTPYDTLLCAFGDILGYSWYACGDTVVLSTAECLSIQTSGCYCVDMWILDTCVYTACEEVIVGIEDPTISNSVSVEPNPTNGKLVLELSDDLLLPCQWTMTTYTGTKIHQGTLSENITELDLGSEMTPGLYFLVLENKEHKAVKKIVFTK